MKKTKYTFCRICEVGCGLKVTVEDNQVVKIEPDRDHPVTKGYVCRKGLHIHDFMYSPDRILHPMKRVAGKWERITWEQAVSEIGARLNQLIREHGANSIAVNAGSAMAFDFAGAAMVNALVDGIGTKNFYGPGSVDCNNKFVVYQHMLGSPFRLTFPDLPSMKMLIAIGANPAVSQMTFIQAPNAIRQIRGIVERGGRVVFINPRRTESARATGEQIFIRPDTDIFFLLAFLNELIRVGGVRHELLSAHMTGYEKLAALSEPWTPERQEKVTTIPADRLRELVSAYSRADGATLYCSTGINRATNATLSFWIAEAINAISGNLDRPGGTIVGTGLFDVPKMMKKAGKLERPDRTRIGNLPSVCDIFPVGILADEILTPGEGQIRALINYGGNPAVTYPNPKGRFEEALSSLDLLVCLDIFRTETANFAHYLLPTTTVFERPDLPMVLHWMAGIQPNRYVQYTERMVEPPEDVREEWWILTKIAHAADIPLFGVKAMAMMFRLLDRLERMPLIGNKLAMTSEKFIGMSLRLAPGAASAKKQVKKYPHGQLLAPNQPGTFLGQRVLTEDGKVHLAPDLFVKHAEKLEDDFEREKKIQDRFKLVCRRERLTHNSWIHNSPAFVGPERPTNYAYLNPADAEKLDLHDGDTAELSTPFGSVRIPVKVSDEMMPGTVAVPHGWGHAKADGLTTASKFPGVNINYLTPDGPDGCEKLAGMSHMTGVVVDIRKPGS